MEPQRPAVCHDHIAKRQHDGLGEALPTLRLFLLPRAEQKPNWKSWELEEGAPAAPPAQRTSPSSATLLLHREPTKPQ